MLEITSEDIAKLNDERLREVVARLCEAELLQRGQSPAYVTWGGHQKASDGGIDVRVALPAGASIDGFVPRPTTGYQVKQEDTPAGRISDEMLPKGKIRPAITALAEAGGAYVMVSSQGSTADTALTARREAMQKAIQEVPHADELFVDFYDRTRIATWVRTHACLIPWVRTLAGRRLRGWQSYGSWAWPKENLNAEYLVDTQARLSSPSDATAQGLSVVEGINTVRKALRQAQRVVRLVGLSGVGKTRFAQALFDHRIGADSLDPSVALYTNIGDSPEPPPVSMAADLASAGTPAILIVDNCPPELHRRLSEFCQQDGSKLSLLTIEYDIRDDTPEGTDVYTLAASSSALIEELLRRRFPALSAVDRQAIAATDFCGGNARIALALAGTVKQQETIAGLSDEALFQRLFQQRHAHDPSLLRSAQACALVYSFQGDDFASEESELARLGALVEQSPGEIYRNVAELQARDLAQQRGMWRAILPHAVANRLAAAALRTIPYGSIELQLLPSERLWRSFSRRLGYLGNSVEAARIVKGWLSDGGALADVGDLSELGQTIFHNVAPVAPEASLGAIERALLVDRPDSAARCTAHCRLLRSLAYDPALFEQSTEALATILGATPEKSASRQSDLFTSLFHMFLSGTRAPIEMRVKVLESLLLTTDAGRRDLGVRGLGALLTAGNFMAADTFEFGGQSRDFGYWPQTRAEIQNWFSMALRVVESLGCANVPVSSAVRNTLADHFRFLWLYGADVQQLQRVCRALAGAYFWPEGWRAVKEMLQLDGEALPDEQREALQHLEEAIRPSDLVQKVNAIVLCTNGGFLEVDDEVDSGTDDIVARIDRIQLRARELGEEVARDAASLSALIPSLVGTPSNLLWFFGEGLAIGTTDPEGLWRRLILAFAATDKSARQPEVMRGFLARLSQSKAALVGDLLEEALNDGVLGEWYPHLQTAVPLQADDVARLMRSLTMRRAPVRQYSALAYALTSSAVSPADSKALILGVAELDTGYDAAVEILYGLLLSLRHAKQLPEQELILAGRTLLQRATLAHNARRDSRLEDIAQTCLTGNGGDVIATQICTNLRSAIAAYQTNTLYHGDLLMGILTAQPIAALDALFGGTPTERKHGLRILEFASTRCPLLGVVPDSIIVRWCQRDPGVRFRALAKHITAWQATGGQALPQWTPLGLQFLANASDPAAVLHDFVAGFDPHGGFVGSQTTGLERNAVLLDQLGDLPGLHAAIAREKEMLRAQVDEVRRMENLVERQFNERFE